MHHGLGLLVQINEPLENLLAPALNYFELSRFNFVKIAE